MENVTITLSFKSLEEAAVFLNEKVSPATKIESVKVAKSAAKVVKDSDPIIATTSEEPKTEDAPLAKKSFDKAASKAEVRAAALELSKAGKTDEIAAIFKKYGAKSLSGIKEECYAAVLEDLKEVENA